MRTTKFWRLAFAMLAAFSFVSCSSDDEGGQEYQPAHRSAIFNEVKVLLTDADGNDLGSSAEIFSSMKVYGELSRQYTSIESVVEDGLTYLKFKADLPDERSIKYDEDNRSGTGTSTMNVTVDGKTARLTFTFRVTNSSNGEEMYGGSAIHITGVQLGSEAVANGNNDDMVIVLLVGESGLSLTDEVPVPEESSKTAFMVELPLASKVFLGSGYDVTGAYLSNDCLRENVIDPGKCDDNQLQNISLNNSTGRLLGDVSDASGFLSGLCAGLSFDNAAEPGDVYFVGTFTDNPLFMPATERGEDYSFLMYIDHYSVYAQRLHIGLYPSKTLLESILTDEFQKALAEESAERIVERFGTHVLMNARLGLNILSLYRTGLKVNTSDEARFEASMFRRMSEVYNPISWNKTTSKATKGGALTCQFSGGSTQQLYAAIGNSPIAQDESQATIAKWWNESCASQTNLSLAWLQGEDLWPIYKLVPDETKREEVKLAVKAYIHNHQLN